MKKIFLPEKRAKALFYRMDAFLENQELEIRYLRKVVAEIKEELKLL